MSRAQAEIYDLVYDIDQGCKRTLASETRASPTKYSAAFRSRSTRFCTPVAFANGLIRNPTAGFSYTNSLGPGDFHRDSATENTRASTAMSGAHSVMSKDSLASRESTQSSPSKQGNSVFKSSVPRFSDVPSTAPDSTFSFARENQAWQKNGLNLYKSDRFNKRYHSPPKSAFELNLDTDCGTKKTLGSSVRDSGLRYSVFSSGDSRLAKGASFAAGLVRYPNLKPPYSKPIGPGKYTTSTDTIHTNDPSRPSCSFVSTVPRFRDPIVHTASTSNTFKRDKKEWNQKGFYGSKGPRFNTKTFASGDGADTFYDVDYGNKATLATSINNSSVKYSAMTSVKSRFSEPKVHRSTSPDMLASESPAKEHGVTLRSPNKLK